MFIHTLSLLIIILLLLLLLLWQADVHDLLYLLQAIPILSEMLLDLEQLLRIVKVGFYCVDYCLLGLLFNTWLFMYALIDPLRLHILHGLLLWIKMLLLNAGELLLLLHILLLDWCFQEALQQINRPLLLVILLLHLHLVDNHLLVKLLT